MNQACILKLGRKIQDGSHELWCKVLIGKYKKDVVEGILVAKANDS